MGQPVPFTHVSEVDIARALAEVSQDGWPADEEDLVRLFGRVLSALAGDRECDPALTPGHTLLLLQKQ
jgi:hypothetical protein